MGPQGRDRLAVRFPNARHSRDADLVRSAETFDVDTAFDELTEAAQRTLGDPFTFVVRRPRPASPNQLTVEVYLAGLADQFDLFPIDLSSRAGQIAPLEYAAPTPLITGLDFGPLPSFALYPIENQIADKLCAMYELHGDDGRPSTRYHDLVDLVVITGSRAVDGTVVTLALTLEESRRTGLDLPPRMFVPSPTWRAGYAKVAAASPIDKALRDLDQAMARVARFADPVLAQDAYGLRWDPAAGRWS